MKNSKQIWLITAFILYCPLYLIAQQSYSISILPGSQVVSGTAGTLIPLEIKIGDPDSVLSPDNFYGVSFDLSWDNTEYIEYSNLHSAGPWLGANPLVFIQSYPDHIEAGFSRTVRPGETGSGIVLFCSLKVKAASPADITSTLTLSNITAVQEDGSPLDLLFTGSTVIYIDPYSISILPNSQQVFATVNTLIPLEIKIGDPDSVMSPDNFYGVAFDLNWDNTDYIEYAAGNDVAGPWLGTNPLKIIQPYTDHIEAGLSRSDGSGVTGSGIVLLCSLKVKAAPPNEITANLTLSNITAVQDDGSPLDLSFTGPSTVTLTVGVEVWPGDANNDGEVNAADILPLGLNYNQTGPPRNDPSNCNWEPQIGEIWDDSLATYADCNGDGTVNATDILCIGLNYGRTHSVTILASGPVTTGSGSPPLRKENPNAPLLSYNIYNANNKSTSINNFKRGDNFYLSVSIDNPADILGISFSVDWKGIRGNAAALEVIDGWGTNGIKTAEVWGEKVISLSKASANDGRIDIGITKTDGIAILGQNSELVRIKMKVIDEESISFNFEDIYANDVEGNMIEVRSIALERGLSRITETVPENFQLGNYPNPFNPATNISFSLSEDSRVRITVYNLLGELVAEPVNSYFASGSHTIAFDASEFTSGMYFYQMEAREFIEIKKMTLMK